MGEAKRREMSLADMAGELECAGWHVSPPPARLPIDDRYAILFLSKINRAAGDDGCWLWTGGIDAHGYGAMALCIEGKPKTVKAHRLSYEMAHGPISPFIQVRHRCDVRHCVNPGHLIAGSNADNQADLVARGRRARGNHHGARLTEEGVARLRAAPISLVGDIAAEFGVSRKHAMRVRRGGAWTWGSEVTHA